MAELRVFASVSALNFALAEAVASTINSAVRANGRCSIALAGGTTPRRLYTVLAMEFRKHVPWKHLHVFWGDERVVPPGDPMRNDRMAREMLLDKVPCPKRHIHAMATRANQAPVDAAREYEETMRQYFTDGRPRFDLVILGLGAEGHTASLFPRSPALDEREQWVCAVKVPAKPSSRLTLTLPVFNQAANVYFLATGAAKARALRAALNDGTDPNMCPAAAVRPADGKVTWWADGPAAAGGTRDHDIHKGAVEETDHDPIVPIDPRGANFDDSEVSNADEKGKTTDHPRDEQR
jgi:6-phosphogluconolactonase